MVPTLDSLAAELRPQHNSLCVLHDDTIVRLIGVGADDRDLYYIVQDRKHPYTRTGNVVWSSAVGHITPLKGVIDPKAYARMEALFSLNGCPPTDGFLVKDQSVWDMAASDRGHMVSKCGRFAILFDHQQPDLRFALWRLYPETPEAPRALLLRGEFAPLAEIVGRMLAEMASYAHEQTTEGHHIAQRPHDAPT